MLFILMMIKNVILVMPVKIFTYMLSWNTISDSP